ncbi:phosphopantetheine-binding protein [Mycoplasmopsis cricetuli]|uniref:phosphopantetheine-binding protein n=1 Tax=Mycoplasmopsis cricetuli TaxID=171283 RepID=UPI000470F3B6|nr:phosphopantetheine-binding protein [Mycoplasmopsis cricetuli]
MKSNVKEIMFKELQKYTNTTFNMSTKISDLKIDSLDLAEMIIDAEEKYNIIIDDKKINDVKTVEDVILLIENSLK